MEGHAIVEMMGHRRVVGRVSETELCGVKLLRVETLTDPPVVQLVSPASLYAVTLCSEEQALRAGRYQSSPLRELDALPAPPPVPREAIAYTGPSGSSPPPSLPPEDEGRCPKCHPGLGEPCHPDCPEKDCPF